MFTIPHIASIFTTMLGLLFLSVVALIFTVQAKTTFLKHLYIIHAFVLPQTP